MHFMEYFAASMVRHMIFQSMRNSSTRKKVGRLTDRQITRRYGREMKQVGYRTNMLAPAGQRTQRIVPALSWRMQLACFMVGAAFLLIGLIVFVVAVKAM